jgi:hypothetical protein
VVCLSLADSLFRRITVRLFLLKGFAVLGFTIKPRIPSSNIREKISFVLSFDFIVCSGAFAFHSTCFEGAHLLGRCYFVATVSSSLVLPDFTVLMALW